ncbi:MAG: hypothetical protein HGB18_05475 [Candidatus Moranbacteria bacterium]|nr:hypothetical protein [Candidatus Moranbacteria bacterium]
MPGMNLAHSSQDSDKIRTGFHVGPGLLFLIGIVTAVVLAWGGLSVYEGILTKSLEETDSRIASEQEGMPQAKIDQVADFHYRLARISDDGKDSDDAREVLDMFGSRILPGTVLSDFSFDSETRTVRIQGEADSFRTAAQQMTAFKGIDGLRELKVPGLDRNDRGTVSFRFTASL